MNLDKSPVKVNLGCGVNIIDGDGWINCDNSLVAKIRRTPLWSGLKLLIKFGFISNFYLNYPKLQIFDIRKKLPFNDNSVQFIYCSQVVEHLHLYELQQFLKECRRVLSAGGIIRILTPDLRKITELYLRRDLKLFTENDYLQSDLLADHFNLIFYPRSWIQREKRSIFTRFLDSIPEHHKYIFDREALSELMFAAGFNRVECVATSESNFPNARELDKFQEVSLEIEASH